MGWRHVTWDAESPNRQIKQRSRWGWIFYRRVKTGKSFYRPMNRTVHAHIKSIMPKKPAPNTPVFLGGSARPNMRFRRLCDLAGINAKMNIETGEEKPWLLKDLRKTCATYYDEHVPESSIEILGHSVAGVTYRHYAHRSPLAFRAIMTLPQPSAFAAMVNGFDGQCPYCQRSFADVIHTSASSHTCKSASGYPTSASWRRGLLQAVLSTSISLPPTPSRPNTVIGRRQSDYLLNQLGKSGPERAITHSLQKHDGRLSGIRE